MQACPYDALYIDPMDNTAQKCNYCAHRVDVGLQPACVIVCPEQAIIAGDIDDPATQIGPQRVWGRRPGRRGTRRIQLSGVDRLSLAGQAPVQSARSGSVAVSNLKEAVSSSHVRFPMRHRGSIIQQAPCDHVG